MAEPDFDLEVHFREMLRHSPSMFAIIDRDFIYRFANEAYASQLSMQPSDIIGQSVRDVLGESGFEDSLDRFVDAVIGNTVEYEAELVIGQRSIILATKLVPFPSDVEAKDIKGFYLFSTDVTGKRVSQQALSLILASAPGRICHVNRDFEVTYANSRFNEDYHGSAEAKGLLLETVLQSSIWSIAKPNIERAFQGQFVRYHELNDPHDTASARKVVYIIPDRAKDPQVINGAYCLIFEEAELEFGRQRLRRRERNIDLALRGQMVGVWEMDPTREDWFLTEHIEKLLGLAAGELNNSETLTLKRIHPDDLPEVLRKRRLYLKTDDVYVNEFRMQSQSGEYRWFRSIGRSELDTQGNSVYFAGTIADINELKSAELLAAEQVKHRDSFLSMLSHELRNPVAAIKYALDAFPPPGEPSNPLAEQHQNALAIVNRQTNIIARLLKDLLNVNRIRQNQILFEDAEVCLVKLTNDIVDVSNRNFIAKNQVLKYHCDLDTFQIVGDEVRLHQVFVNLLDNASKYSPPATEVQFKISRDPQTGDFLATVSDQGYGIKPKAQSNIFDLFFQEDPPLDRAAGGLGVGLYLVKQIIEAHHGTIRVTSPGANGGSDFDVRLPATAPPQKTTAATAHSDALRQLVLVEDNDDSRVALSLALSARGFEVQTFSDGETAASEMPALQPEIALVDIGLPRMDGMSLIKELHRHEKLKDTIFIALTGYGQVHERTAIIEAGFDHHLVKPLDLDDLFRIIAQQRRRTKA